MTAIKPRTDATKTSDREQPDRMYPDREAGGAAVETGGPGEPEPTRYGDWEKNGRCIDF